MLAAERELAAGDESAGVRLGEAIGDVVGPRRLRARGPVGRRLPADRRAPALDEVGDRAAHDAVGRRAQAARARPAASPPTPRCCCSTSPTTSSTSRPSARSRSDPRDAQDRPADQPRPRAADARPATRSSRSRATAPGSTAAPTPPTPRRASTARSCSATALARWKDEERRLRELVRTLQGARAVLAGLGQEGRRDGDALAALRRRRPAARARRRPADPGRACAAATRARRVVALHDVAIDGLVRPFTDEVHFGERVGLDRPQRHRQDAPHAPARRRGRPARGPRRARPARLARALHPAQRARRLRRARRCSTS